MADSEQKFKRHDRGRRAVPGPHEPAPLNEGRPQNGDAPEAGDAPAVALRRARVRVGVLSALIAFLLYLAALSPSGDRSPAGGSDADGVPRSRPPAGRQRSTRERLPHSGLAILLFAVVLTLIGSLDGSSRPAEALSPQGTESISALESAPGGAGGSLTSWGPESPSVPDFLSGGAVGVLNVWGNAGDSARDGGNAGTLASSSVSCPSGYYLTLGGLACAKVESRAASLSCPSGSSKFSLGVAPAWRCRKDLGAASTSYSCASGTLVWRTVGSGFARMCKITTSSTETKNASASCSPRGMPTSCRYSFSVLTPQTQSASASCNPRGTPTSCSYSAQITTLRTQSASASCSPKGAPTSCSYTAQVSSRQTQSASRYCTPRGTPASCRYLLRQSRSASYRYIVGTGGYHYCSSGWTLSGSTCYRYVTRYGSLQYSCPSGWTRSGATCYRYVTSNVTRYGTLTYTCPPGWSRSGATCSRNVTSTVTRYGTLSYSCPPGWSRSGSTCTRYVTTTLTRYGTLNYSCPPGWTRSGSTCTRTTSSTRYVSPSSSQSCGTGTLSGGRCWSYPAKIKTCSNGWRLSSGSCTRILYTSPNYTYHCPQGRTLRGTRCYTTPTTTTTSTTTTSTTTTTAASTTTTTAPVAPPPPPPPPAVTTTTSTTTTTVASESPQAGTTTTTTTTTLTCASPSIRIVALGCVAPPSPPPNFSALRAPASIRVFWQSSDNTGGAGVTIENYAVQWREASSTGNFTTSATVTPSRQGLEFFESTITGLTNGIAYHVTVQVTSSATDSSGTSLSNFSPTLIVVPRAARGPGGWQPYQLPEDQTVSLNEKIRRGEPLSVCTTTPDFVQAITDAVNAWNNTLNPTGSDFQNVFTFNGLSHPTACGEQLHPTHGRATQIFSRNNFDIIVSDYRCTPTTTTTTTTTAATATTTTTACQAPAAQQGCLPRAGRPSSTVLCSYRRCTDSRTDTLYCAATTASCPGVLGCAWPIFFRHSGDDPGLVEGSAVQIVASKGATDTALFAHELGHLLGLADYGFQCAWEDRVTGGSPDHPQITSDKLPSLFSYSDGPRSWRAVIANPRLFTDAADYFNCRSPNITPRDEQDFRSIYRPKRFTNNRFISETTDPNGIWRLEFGDPPTDVNRRANTGLNTVYNAHRWLILHKAPDDETPLPGADCTYNDNAYTTLTADTNKMATDTSSDDELLVFTLGQLKNPPSNSLGTIQNGHFRLNTNFNTPPLRQHKFIIVGITRGDPKANDSLALGVEKSVVSLDLDGDGVLEDWTLGEPSLPFRTRPCNSTALPPLSPSTTTTTTP